MEKEISIQERNKQFNITMKQIDTRQKIFIFTIIILFYWIVGKYLGEVILYLITGIYFGITYGILDILFGKGNYTFFISSLWGFFLLGITNYLYKAKHLCKKIFFLIIFFFLSFQLYLWCYILFQPNQAKILYLNWALIILKSFFLYAIALQLAKK